MFELPQYCGLAPDMETLIAFGHASTDKAAVLKQALKSTVLKGIASMRVFEVRDEKIYDLVSGKVKEIVEEQGLFHVLDLQKIELAAADVLPKTEKLLYKRKGHLFIQLEHRSQRSLFVQLAAPSS